MNTPLEMRCARWVQRGRKGFGRPFAKSFPRRIFLQIRTGTGRENEPYSEGTHDNPCASTERMVG